MLKLYQHVLWGDSTKLLQCPTSGASEYCSGFQLSLTASRILEFVFQNSYYSRRNMWYDKRVRVVFLANSAWIEVMMNRLSRNSKV